MTKNEIKEEAMMLSLADLKSLRFSIDRRIEDLEQWAENENKETVSLT